MSREQRKGENESWFRARNEEFELRSLDRPGSDLSFEIVCECALEACEERLTIGYRAYESVRADATFFILVLGHSDASVERVVSATNTYEIVRKIGEAALVALIEDPRS